MHASNHGRLSSARACGRSARSPPPRDRLRGRRLAGRRAVADRGPVHGPAVLDGRLQERGMEPLHVVASAARALRKEHDALAAGKPLLDRAADAHDVCALRPIDEQGLHRARQHAEERPARDLAHREEDTPELAGEEHDVDVAQVVADEQEGRLGRSSLHVDPHADQARRPARPGAEDAGPQALAGPQGAGGQGGEPPRERARRGPESERRGAHGDAQAVHAALRGARTPGTSRRTDARRRSLVSGARSKGGSPGRRHLRLLQDHCKGRGRRAPQSRPRLSRTARMDAKRKPASRRSRRGSVRSRFR